MTDSTPIDPSKVSDEAFMELSDEDFLEAQQDTGVVENQEEVASEESDDEPQTEEESADDSSDDEQDASDEESDTPDEESDAGEPAAPEAKTDPDSEKPAPKDAAKPEPVAAEKPPEIDYKAFYDRVTGTFKANGKEMRVADGEDIVKLMQMGANYNRKMAAMKPHLKILKTLEKAEISEEKLNFLIDLDRKDPVAISRLIKEAGLDPLDIDLKKSDEYTATNYSANDTELALDEVIEEIKDSPHYNATLTLVATKWDAVSKQAVVDSPQLLKVINDHMASGVYDLISTEMEKERMFGRLRGMSDLQAYKAVGDAIEARNGFAHLFQPEQPKPIVAPSKPDPSKAAKEAQRKDKKRAASPPKASSSSAKPDFNPLAVSDEEFDKQFDSRFM